MCKTIFRNLRLRNMLSANCLCCVAESNNYKLLFLTSRILLGWEAETETGLNCRLRSGAVERVEEVALESTEKFVLDSIPKTFFGLKLIISSSSLEIRSLLSLLKASDDGDFLTLVKSSSSQSSLFQVNKDYILNNIFIRH